MTDQSKKSVRNGTSGLQDRHAPDFRHQRPIEALDDKPFDSLITSAILAATAFRLRDQDALTQALRRLVQAVRPFEVQPSED